MEVAMRNRNIQKSICQSVKNVKSTVEEIHFPDLDGHIGQEKEWCEVVTKRGTKHIRFHDYEDVFSIPGLYEELFHNKLDCQSPFRVTNLLDDVLDEFDTDVSELNVLEIGAGNGVVGETLKTCGVHSITGIDILDEAKRAAERDRPEVYDDYLIVDLTDIPEPQEEQLRNRQFNCLITVAALGFGDIPPHAFAKALDMIEIGGWIAFNIKEDFVYQPDQSGFACLIEELTHKQILQYYAYRRYRHRFSITGDSLYYIAYVARKLQDISDEFLQN
jgi:hypothetical protein